MIYIAHGEDIAKTRILLNNQQKKLGVPSKTELDITEVSPQNLTTLISQKDIFGNGVFLVLDISAAGKMNMDPYIETLKKTPEYATVTILADRTLPNSSIFIKKSASLNARIIESSVTPEGNIFKFLDQLFYKNRKGAYQELAKLQKENYDDFRLFSMLLYALRNIAYKKFGAPSFTGLKPFQKDNISRQAELFSKQKVKELFSYFYELDKKTKTGEITPDLMVTGAIEKVLNS